VLAFVYPLILRSYFWRIAEDSKCNYLLSCKYEKLEKLIQWKNRKDLSKKANAKTFVLFTALRRFRAPFPICIIYNNYLQKSSQNAPVIKLQSAMSKNTTNRLYSGDFWYQFNWHEIYFDEGLFWNVFTSLLWQIDWIDRKVVLLILEVWYSFKNILKNDSSLKT